MAHVKITPEIESVVRNSRIEGSKLFLPNQLDRKLYVEVNKCLVNCGGKWTKNVQAHVFDGNPLEKLGLALETGVSRDEKKDSQAFYTPANVASLVVSLAEVNGCRVLEPSAGIGNLVSEILVAGAEKVDIVEQNPASVKILKEKYHYIYEGDFLSWEPTVLYDRVVMNPPFTKNQDVKHVEKAFSLLKNGGKLVSIMAGNRTRKPFLELIKDKDYEIIDLPAGSFKESGTMVNCMVLILEK